VPAGHGDVRGGGVDPPGDRLPGAVRAEPELLPGDLQVARDRHRPVHLHGVGRSGVAGGHRRDVIRCLNDRRWRWQGGFRCGVQVGRQPQRRVGIRAGTESVGRAGHVQRLVRAAGVVVDPPGIHRGLRIRHRGERGLLVEELALNALVPALHLAGGGR
jgi:hypothetical protein